MALATAGARLVLNDLPGDLQAAAEEIRAGGGQAVACAGDIGDWQTGQDLVAAALGSYGQLDILVNNAGLVRDRMVFSMSAEEWDLVIRVHLRGHFVTTRFATAHWRAASKQTGGPVYARIINTSSEAFLLGSPGQPNYAAAKAGITALTLSTARGCARYGVRANAICPRGPHRDDRRADGRGTGRGRADPLAPEHVAPLVAYLASPAAAAINGEVFVVHGGVAAVMAPPRIRATVPRRGARLGRRHVDAGVGARRAGPGVRRAGTGLGQTALAGEARVGFWRGATIRPGSPARTRSAWPARRADSADEAA